MEFMVRFPMPAALTLVALLLASGLGLIASTHQVRADYARLQMLELERWQLQEQYTRLLLEINTRAAPHRVGQIASEVLAMQPPDLGVTQVVTE